MLSSIRTTANTHKQRRATSEKGCARANGTTMKRNQSWSNRTSRYQQSKLLKSKIENQKVQKKHFDVKVKKKNTLQQELKNSKYA